MPELSVIQVVIVLVIALLVFGPSRLPELGRQLGRGMRELKRHAGAVGQDLTRAVDDPDPPVPREPVPADQATAAHDGDDLLDGILVAGDHPPGESAPHTHGTVAVDGDDDLLAGVVVPGDEPPDGSRR